MIIDIDKFFKKWNRKTKHYEIQYFEQCKSCKYDCKQSYKVVKLMCQKYDRKPIGYRR